MRAGRGRMLAAAGLVAGATLVWTVGVRAYSYYWTENWTDGGSLSGANGSLVTDAGGLKSLTTDGGSLVFQFFPHTLTVQTTMSWRSTLTQAATTSG